MSIWAPFMSMSKVQCSPIPVIHQIIRFLAGPLQSQSNTIVALCAAAALSTATILQQKVFLGVSIEIAESSSPAQRPIPGR